MSIDGDLNDGDGNIEDRKCQQARQNSSFSPRGQTRLHYNDQLVTE